VGLSPIGEFIIYCIWTKKNKKSGGRRPIGTRHLIFADVS
jgi:hypothetical protein